MAQEIPDARDAALTGLYDDVSVLPPTRRALADALTAHAEALDGGMGWLVNRLIVGLQDVDALAEHPAGAAPIRVGVVVSRAGGSAFGAPMVQDLERVVPLIDAPGVVLDAVEMTVVGKRPDEEVGGILEAITAAGLGDDVAVEVEVPIGDRPAGEVIRTISAIAAARDGGRRMVARARVGAAGTVPAPGEVELAGFLMACADVRVPITAGPGLSGPVRTDDQDTAHGYLNLVAAAVMAYRGSPLAQIKGVLAVPAGQVRLGSGALIVGDEVVESDLMAACRRDFLLSAGVADIPAEVAALDGLEVLTGEGDKA